MRVCLKCGCIEDDRQLYVMRTIDIQKQDYLVQVQKLDHLFQSRSIVDVKIFLGHDAIHPVDKRLLLVYELCIKLFHLKL